MYANRTTDEPYSKRKNYLASYKKRSPTNRTTQKEYDRGEFENGELGRLALSSGCVYVAEVE
jgi:hypothetical protein